ncbi:MAG: twin-arginine translocase subunit TatC [Betaproteobacteria bacterium]|jgi:sec-independent protein translocase protein TatC|nr:twin-arginine translocase subunit TatC [Betaproteobacteria bacterium]
MSEDTFISHLVELRDRLLRALAAFGVVLLVLVPFASELYDLMASPMMRALPEGSKMIATGVITPFLVPIKVAMMLAFVVTLPYTLYQAWSFVAPGLYQHEKQLVLPLVVASTLLFLVGIAFCYFFVFNTVFHFIHQIAPKSISVAPDIENYLNFVLTMFLAFGLTFETPIVVVMLTRMGIVTIEQLREARSYFIVGAFVVAAVVTPPDVVSQLLLAIPMCLLFELGLVAARFVPPRPRAEESGAASGGT